MMKNDDKNTGYGKISPNDADEFIEINLTFADDEVVSADYNCFDDAYLIDCAETICRMVKYHTAQDIMQVTNNVVFYNTKNDLPRNKLYLGAMAVMCVKRATADWGRKNSIEFSSNGGCSCY